MILVTVGMHSDGFLRLVEAIDRLAAQIDEEVIIQTGATPYRPQAAHWFAFADQAQMDAYCRQARIIVSHAGAGSILTALDCRKPLIVVPRRQQYGEIVDDHQLELAQALAEAGMLVKVDDPEDVAAHLEEMLAPVPAQAGKSHLVEAVREAVAGNHRQRM